jgi:hypothetical protein
MVFVKFNFKFAKPTKSYEIHKTRVSQYTGCIKKKTAHAITLLLMTQMKKKYTVSEHIIFIPSTHLWAMNKFYFSNGNL